MTTDAARRCNWSWIVAVAVGVPVLYVASFGPACWLVEAGKLLIDPAALIFDPVLRIERHARMHGPDRVSDLLRLYGDGSSPGIDSSTVVAMQRVRGIVPWD